MEEAEFSGSSLIEFLQGKLEELSLQLDALQAKHEKSLFRLENIKDDDYQINLYTSFPDYDTLLYFYKNILESDTKVSVNGEVVNQRIIMQKKRLVEATNFPC